MRRIAVLIPIIGILFCSMFGCVRNPTLDVDIVRYERLPNNVKRYFELYEQKNGIYLYSSREKESYLFLNQFNVVQGEKAAFFTDIRFEITDNFLNIFIDKDYTDDYSNSIDNRLFYVINDNSKFEYINVYINDIETYFDAIGAISSIS